MKTAYGMRMQRGASLVVVLLLLLIMTLLGVFVLRGTLMEERMSSNVLDRGLGFQAAESALRQAEAAIEVAVEAGTDIGFNCDVADQICPTIPANAYTGSAGACAPGTQNCWINATAETSSGLSAGAPQYYIEYMGEKIVEDIGGGSANDLAYEGGGGGRPVPIYRVTARNSNPAAVAGRAVVVLQSTVVGQ